MKTLNKFFAFAVIALLLSACKNDKQPEIKTVETAVATAKKELNPNATYAKAEFTIEGMTCKMGCAKTIEKKIANMDGVKSATVDFDRKLAMVEYDNAQVNPDLLTETVLGVADTYKVHGMKTVDAFSKEGKKECAKDCKKKCDSKSENKTASKEDCPKDCCKKDEKKEA